MVPGDKDTDGEEMIGQLIAAAGPGETASAEAKQRVYAAVQSRWRESLSSRPGDAVRTRTAGWRRPARLRGLGLAAGIAAAAVTLYWLQGSGPAALGGAEMARIAQIEGSAELVRGGDTERLAGTAVATEIRAGDRLTTTADGRLALDFATGLSLRIDVDTDLVLAAADAVELISGTIYLDSGEEAAAAALGVRTPLGSVEHIGTQYEVRLDGAALRVRIREGAVAYSGAGGRQIGMAGEELRFDGTGLTGRSRIAPDADAWNWAAQLATLPPAEEYDLLETLAWAARESGLALVYQDPTTAARRAGDVVNGEYLAGYQPAETLTVLPQLTTIRFQIRDGRLIVEN